MTIKPFSASELNMSEFKDKIELEEAFSPGIPFPKSEMSSSASLIRLKKAVKDFAYFDEVYFPPDCYSDYAEPNKMLKDIIKFSRSEGIHIFFGPRNHGKTVQGKKILVWLLLTGQVSIAGTYAETLNPKSYNILADVSNIIKNSPRIQYDFKPVLLEDNADQIQFKLKLSLNTFKQLPRLKGFRYCAAFSQGRSVRGYTKEFGRPQFILGDDVETLESAFNTESNLQRIDKLVESYHSMIENSTFLIMANDFSTASALHQLKIQAEDNLLANNLFHFHTYSAWDDKNKKPLWPEKYPAKSESELKAILKPKDESDWNANYRNDPKPPEGIFFKRQYYKEYTSLPNDCRGVIYCDPNLSKKGKGDTTAIVPLLFSPKTNCYYVPMAVCRSFSDSNQLLDSILILKKQFSENISQIAFDGQVSQESTWTQLVRDYVLINKIPFPVIQYKSYKVDDLAKNLQMVYSESRIFFPPGFAKTPEGETFLFQFFSFAGKKAGRKDDAPDAAICAFEFIHECSLHRESQPVTVIKDYYSLL